MEHRNLVRSESYNEMLEVFPAAEIFKAREWEQDLQALSMVVLKHKFAKQFGIRLLHRHNKLNIDEYMVEREEILFDGIKCLTTLATTKSDISHQLYPNSWMLREDAMLPIEHSEDEVVSLDGIDQKDIHLFFDDFGDVLRERRLESVLGPCVLPRSFYVNKNSDNQKLVETSDELRRANILRFMDATSFDEDDMIEATWTVIEPTGLSEAAVICYAGCKAEKYCVKDQQGGHNTRSRHRKFHTPQ